MGSNIASDSEVKNEVKIYTAKAARTFGCLKKHILGNQHFSMETKRKVSITAVLHVSAAIWNEDVDHQSRESEASA